MKNLRKMKFIYLNFETVIIIQIMRDSKDSDDYGKGEPYEQADDLSISPSKKSATIRAQDSEMKDMDIGENKDFVYDVVSGEPSAILEDQNKLKVQRSEANDRSKMRPGNQQDVLNSHRSVDQLGSGSIDQSVDLAHRVDRNIEDIQGQEKSRDKSIVSIMKKFSMTRKATMQNQMDIEDLMVGTTAHKSGLNFSEKTKTQREIDEETSGIFEVHGKPYVSYDKRSLFIFDHTFKLRRMLVWLVEWNWFDRFITTVIILNSILFATQDYISRLDPNNEPPLNKITEQMDTIFSLIFLVECVMKIIAMGFIMHSNSYLKDYWNMLDFFIVVISVVGMLPNANSESLKPLRTFRVLKPLRSVNALPSLKTLISSLLSAIPGLFNVCLFLMFIFSIFAIFGVTQFKGKTYQFCRVGDPQFSENGSEFLGWEINQDADRLCSLDPDDYERTCAAILGKEANSVCGTVYEAAGVDPTNYDRVLENELISYGIPNFDHFANALVTVFQILTLEGWSGMLYNYSDAGDPVSAVIFFVFIVLLGAFYSINLLLASIMESFNSQQEQIDKLTELREKKQQKELEQMKQDEQEKSQNPENKSSKANQVLPLMASEKLTQSMKNKLDMRQKMNHAATIEDLHPNLAFSPPQSALKNPETNIGSDQLGNHLDMEEEHIGESYRNHSERQQNEDVNQAEVASAFQTERTNFKNNADYEQRSDQDISYDEELYEKDARKRSYSNCIYRLSYKLVTNFYFNFLIFCLIIANTIVLALYRFDDSQEKSRILEALNVIFTWIFLFEMILKLIGLGVRSYFMDSYNQFDCVIVIISIIDFTLTQIPGIDQGASLKALRALRLLRMIKLSRQWKALQIMLSKIKKSLVDISSFSLLLFIFMYIFALLGMELFAEKALLDEDENLIVGRENLQNLYSSGKPFLIPRENFNNIGYALTTVFMVILGEDWPNVMQLWVRAISQYENPDEIDRISYFIGIMFFICLMILGHLVLFSLFTAILLQNFEQDQKQKQNNKEDTVSVEKLTFKERLMISWKETKRAFGVREKKVKEDLISSQLKKTEQILAMKEKEIMNKLKNMYTQSHDKSSQKQRRAHILLHYSLNQKQSMFNTSQTGDSQNESQNKMKGKSLFLFSQTNRFRKLLFDISESPIFVNFILVLIIISTVTLALDSPLEDQEQQKYVILQYIDDFMTIAFTLEAIIKIISLGFISNGRSSYLRNPWNVLDFIIVVSAILGFVGGESIDVSFIKAVRILRVLRPLRIIARNKGLKIAITSLFHSIPSIFNLQVIVISFIFILAILQTTLFSGTFSYCHTEQLTLSYVQKVQLIQNQWDCINYGGEWVTPDLNFDSTWSSMLTLMTIQTTEGWTDVLWGSVDAVDAYHSPIRMNQPLYIILIVIILIVISLLFLNLFVGVVIETYNNENALMTKNHLLNRSVKIWLHLQIMTLKAEPKRRLDKRGYSGLKQKSVLLIQNPKFDQAILGLIVINTIILAFNWYMQPESFQLPIEIINYVFMAIFTLEAIIKIYAMNMDYFMEPWNVFDFIVVVMTLLILIVQSLGLFTKIGAMSTILRTLRVCRVFRIVKRLKKLQIIFDSLVDSFPAMGSLGLLLLLLTFMFTIIGLSQFALVSLDGADEMGYHVNFQSFGTGFLTLIRCSTGEAWNSIMFESAKGKSILYQCNENEDFDSIIARGDDPNDISAINGCGSPLFAIIFHLVFQIIVSQVFLNLFIAIIVDSFFGINEIEGLPIDQNTIIHFIEIWSEYDVNATKFIMLDKLPELFRQLASNEITAPLVCFPARILKDEDFTINMIKSLEIPTFERTTKVLFYDVLGLLCNQLAKHKHLSNKIAADKQKQKTLKLLAETQNQGLQQYEVMEILGEDVLDFTVDFEELLMNMSYLNGSIDLVSQLKARTMKLSKMYNHQVDKWSTLNVPQKDTKLSEPSDTRVANDYIFTTKHVFNLVMIQKIFREMMNRNRQVRESPLLVAISSKVQEVLPGHGRNDSLLPFSQTEQIKLPAISFKKNIVEIIGDEDILASRQTKDMFKQKQKTQAVKEIPDGAAATNLSPPLSLTAQKSKTNAPDLGEYVGGKDKDEIFFPQMKDDDDSSFQCPSKPE